MNFKNVVKQIVCSPTPDWELMKAGLDTEYTKMKKEENPNILMYSKITPYTQILKPSENLHRWNSIRK